MQRYALEDRLVKCSDFGVSYIEYGCDVAAHTHDAIELVYVVAGHGDHIIDNNIIRAKRGTLIIMDYNCVHEIRAWETMKYYNIMFNASFLTDRLKSNSSLGELMKDYYKFDVDKSYFCVDFKTEELAKKIEELFFEMLEDGMRKSCRYIELTRCHLDEIINRMITNTQSQGNVCDDVVLLEAMKYITENSADALRLEEVAKRFNHKPEYFSQKLKEYCGMSFKQLLICKRLNNVVEDLMNTDEPVNDIILRHGFTNKTYFYATFEKNYGVKPKFIREYRNNYRRYLELKTKYKNQLTDLFER